MNERLQDLKKYLYLKYKTDKEKGKVNKEWLAKALKDFAKQQGKLVDQPNDRSNSFQGRFQEFLDDNDFSEGRVNQYRVIERAVLRFEEFVRVTKLDSVTRTESKVPINEMASSHMARRTFMATSTSWSRTRTSSQPSPATPKAAAPSPATARSTSI